MNILWIEDFGGLIPGRNLLNQMFENLLSFDAWDNDLLSLISKPADLENFCQQQASVHCIYLCRNYFDYAEFKKNHAILNKMDAIILDIRLDNGKHVDFDLAIPEPYEDKAEFHKNAGFYIFNDLVHLGVPVEKMCFMTGEDSTFGEFQKKCVEIYVPKIECLEKRDKKGYDKLRVWLQEQESDYVKLRRGIIEGCQFLKEQKDKLRFDKFCKEGKKEFLDIDDYLGTLEGFLSLREPVDKKTLFKLFIRTLSHEWEESVEPKELDDKGSLAFSWIMKMTRNWIAHNSTAIFTDLTEQDVAYIFICNMRAMFALDDTVQVYENHLLSLFKKVDDKNQDITLINGEKIKNKDIPLIEFYVSYFNERTNRTDVHNILHDLQNDKYKLQNKGDKFFITGLYHCFWFLTSSHDNKKDMARRNPNSNYPNQVSISRHYTFEFFDYTKTDFLLELARHIYNRSFS
jgi:hypothetical protein